MNNNYIIFHNAQQKLDTTTQELINNDKVYLGKDYARKVKHGSNIKYLQ